MKKIILLFLLVFLLTAALTGCPAQPTEPVESPASDFQYEINGEFIYIKKYIGTSSNVVIPSKIENLPVVSLEGMTGDDLIHIGVFEESYVKTVLIPDSVLVIGVNAFKNCGELVSVTVPENVEYLFGGAFQNCVKLENIDFSKSKLVEIGAGAFEGCSKLSSIRFSGVLEKIEEKAFYDCSSLLEIDFPDTLVTVEGGAFANCTLLKTVTVPENLDLHCFEALSSFHNVPSLEKIIFKEGRKEIKGYAFFAITSKAEITIPSSVEQFSPMPFFLYDAVEFVFLGNCPQIVEQEDFYGNPTIYYDPNTDGWENCEWKDRYSLQPIE